MKAATLEERLWRHVTKTETCWLWSGGHNGRGYGHLARTGQPKVYVHRLSYAIAFGPIPVGMAVCHTCDNPPCCNPAHLFLGTYADNIHDMVAKGRNSTNRSLTFAQAAEIRRRRAAGERGTDLAAEFGTTQQTICDLFKGRTYLDEPERVA